MVSLCLSMRFRKIPTGGKIFGDTKNRDFHEILEKVSAPSIFLKIFGPAGGEAPGKVLRLSKGNSYVDK